MTVENAGGRGRTSPKPSALMATTGSHTRSDEQHLIVNTKSHLSHLGRSQVYTLNIHKVKINSITPRLFCSLLSTIS